MGQRSCPNPTRETTLHRRRTCTRARNQWPNRGSDPTHERIPLRHVRHASQSSVYHAEWEFRRLALIWDGSRPLRPNLYPFARQLHATLTRKPPADPAVWWELYRLTNPYSRRGFALAHSCILVLEDAWTFALAKDAIPPELAEVRRVQLLSECVVVSVQATEVLVRQLLFCTNFQEPGYRWLTLDQLVKKRCLGCRHVGTAHFLSFVGSLAHRYGACVPLEACLEEDLVRQAAHPRRAGAQVLVDSFRPITAEKSRAHLQTQLRAFHKKFVHVLEHLTAVEGMMLEELARQS